MCIDSTQLSCESNKSATTSVTHVTWQALEGFGRIATDDRDLIRGGWIVMVEDVGRHEGSGRRNGTSDSAAQIGLRFLAYLYSAVVGSMMDLTSAIELAGNPPWVACSRMSCSLGAL